ncbi:MAG: hypothetical protein N2Z76_08060 [Treponemataceae bacterium]|nr:hypothetical protein [Treponemataceae bacterium]
MGSFFNSSLFFKLINSPYLSFWPGVFYDTFQKNPLYKIEKDISHIGISAKFILGNLNPIEVEENEVTNLITAAHSLAFSGRIGLITNSDDIVRIIPTLPEEWAERMYYYGEVSSGFLILGMWYEKNYGMGYSIGIGLDSLGNVREVRNYDEWSLISYALYLKVKYNDAMIEPLYRGAGGKWSIVLELSQMEHGSRR